MRLNLLIGGKAGQGINKISEIVSEVLVNQGYFIFNYRDYQSLIRGGHNFNILSISDKWIGSHENLLDGIIAFDNETINFHKNQLKKEAFILPMDNFEAFGKNLNLAFSGALIKILGIEKDVLIKIIKKEFNNEESIKAVEKGFNSQKSKFEFKKLNNEIFIMTGSRGICLGAINSGINLHFSYPMTPSTGVLHELATKELELKSLKVIQPESEISVVNAALGASFAGAKVLIGTSGGGFDLMTEGLSFQGISEIPLVVYLASRPGPGTGIPTYTAQTDLDIALRAGHGEFPRVVIAPGDPIECIENTNEAFYLSEKFGTLSIILSDKHLAESEFSIDKKPNKILDVQVKRKLPGYGIVKTNSHEHDEDGNTTEDYKVAEKNANNRLKKYENIKKECKKFKMMKIHGRKNSKNLIIGWGSTKGAILDSIDGLDCKFMQIIYLKPLSNEIKRELERAKKIILVENNSTGQLGRLIREKTGIKIEDRILKYNGLPFLHNELRAEIKKRLK